EIPRVRSGCGHLGGEFCVTCPQPHGRSGAAEMDRERGSPAAGAEDGDTAHAGVPILRSVPLRSRLTFARCRNRISPPTPAAAMTTAFGAPAPQPAGGNASVGALEPSDTYRVSHTVRRNNGASSSGARGG